MVLLRILRQNINIMVVLEWWSRYSQDVPFQMGQLRASKTERKGNERFWSIIARSNSRDFKTS